MNEGQMNDKFRRKFNMRLMIKDTSLHSQVATINADHVQTMYLLSARSVLFPTSIIITSLPLSVLTSSIHFEVCWNELRSKEKQGNVRLYILLFIHFSTNLAV